MKDLIKAQLYQMSKMRAYRCVFVFFTALSVLFGSVEFLNGADALEEGQLLTASDYATRMGSVPTFAILAISFFTAFICADDLTDKTCNYEMMSGRRRKQAYLARAVVSVVTGVLMGLLMMTLSLAASTVLLGWGDTIPVSAAVTRILLMAFPFFRISCLCVLMSYILKKPALVIVGSYVIMIMLVLVFDTSAGGTGALMSISNLMMLCQYDSWVVFGLDSGAHYVYEPALGAANILMTIGASLGFGAGYLALGYSYFHGDDLE